MSTRNILAVLLVLAMLIGVLTSFTVFRMIDDPDEDYKVSHGYDVSGKCDGYAVTGYGISEYKYEPKDYIYYVKTVYSFTDSDSVVRTGEKVFTVVCDSAKNVNTDLNTKIRSEIIDGIECTVWSCRSGGSEVLFTIGDGDLIIRSYSISDDGMELYGVISPGDTRSLQQPL